MPYRPRPNGYDRRRVEILLDAVQRSLQQKKVKSLVASVLSRSAKCAVPLGHAPPYRRAIYGLHRGFDAVLPTKIVNGLGAGLEHIVIHYNEAAG